MPCERTSTAALQPLPGGGENTASECSFKGLLAGACWGGFDLRLACAMMLYKPPCVPFACRMGHDHADKGNPTSMASRLLFTPLQPGRRPGAPPAAGPPRSTGQTPAAGHEAPPAQHSTAQYTAHANISCQFTSAWHGGWRVRLAAPSSHTLNVLPSYSNTRCNTGCPHVLVHLLWNLTRNAIYHITCHTWSPFTPGGRVSQSVHGARLGLVASHLQLVLVWLRPLKAATELLQPKPNKHTHMDVRV